MPQNEQDRPVRPGTRHLSEDDSDEGTLHRIIREETERKAAEDRPEGERTRPPPRGRPEREGG